MKLDIPAQDRRIHLFAVSDTEQGPARQTFLSRLEDPDATDTTLASVFGHTALDPSGAEVFAIEDVAGMGLRGYLAEAYDIEADVLAKSKARLDALGGDVIVLSPRALGPAAVTLTPPTHIRHIESFLPIAPDSAPREMPKPDLTPPAPKAKMAAPRRTPSWWIVGVVLLALVLIWLGQGG